MLCEKRAFCTKHEAKAMLKSAKERNRAHREECRIYKCDDCNCWHLTSMTLEEYEAMKAAKLSENYMNAN